MYDDGALARISALHEKRLGSRCVMLRSDAVGDQKGEWEWQAVSFAQEAGLEMVRRYWGRRLR